MKSPSTTQSLLALAGFVAATMSAASSGAKFSRNRSRLWYRALNQPAFTPPDKAFPIVWTTLYALMAWSGWRVWRSRPSVRRSVGLTLWSATGGERRMVETVLRRAGTSARTGRHFAARFPDCGLHRHRPRSRSQRCAGLHAVSGLGDVCDVIECRDRASQFLGFATICGPPQFARGSSREHYRQSQPSHPTHSIRSSEALSINEH